jgi:hypothetical protein
LPSGSAKEDPDGGRTAFAGRTVADAAAVIEGTAVTDETASHG